MSLPEADSLKKIIGLCGRISACLSDSGRLCQMIVSSAMELSGCGRARLYALDGAERTLRLAAASDEADAGRDDSPAERASVAGWVAENNEPFSGGGRDKVLALPLRAGGGCVGVLELYRRKGSREHSAHDIALMQLFADGAGTALENARRYASLRRNFELCGAGRVSEGFHDFIYDEETSADLVHVISEIADSQSPVLVTGESGAGKELVAEQIHLRSGRKDAPFVRVNCQLYDSAERRAEFEAAAFSRAGGTVFLDEVSRLHASCQESLLDAMQGRPDLDARFVASTAVPLGELVTCGAFLRNLYFRLNAIPVRVAPLRERKKEILVLAQRFLLEFGAGMKKNFSGFSLGAQRAMGEYFWPHNVRELRNAVERACMAGSPPLITEADLGLPSRANPAGFDMPGPSDDRSLHGALRRFKKAYLEKTLDETGWNQTAAAKILQIQRTYVARLLNELHIRENRKNQS